MSPRHGNYRGMSVSHSAVLSFCHAAKRQQMQKRQLLQLQSLWLKRLLLVKMQPQFQLALPCRRQKEQINPNGELRGGQHSQQHWQLLRGGPRNLKKSDRTLRRCASCRSERLTLFAVCCSAVVQRRFASCWLALMVLIMPISYQRRGCLET